MAAVAGVAVAVGLLYVFFAVAVMRQANGRVVGAATRLDGAIAHRDRLAAEIAEVVRSFAGAAPQVEHLQHTLTARTARADQRSAHERALSETLEDVTSLAANYPELNGDPDYRRLRAGLVDAQGEIGAATAGYNDSAKILNRRLAFRSLRPVAAIGPYRAAALYQPDPSAKG